MIIIKFINTSKFLNIDNNSAINTQPIANT